MLATLVAVSQGYTAPCKCPDFTNAEPPKCLSVCSQAIDAWNTLNTIIYAIRTAVCTFVAPIISGLLGCNKCTDALIDLIDTILAALQKVIADLPDTVDNLCCVLISLIYIVITILYALLINIGQILTASTVSVPNQYVYMIHHVVTHSYLNHHHRMLNC